MPLSKNTLRFVFISLAFVICGVVLYFTIPMVFSNNIKYEFYAINEKLEPVSEIHLSNNEYFIYVNYYGLKSAAINNLYDLYKEALIIDNTQAFFEKSLPGNLL